MSDCCSQNFLKSPLTMRAPPYNNLMSVCFSHARKESCSKTSLSLVSTVQNGQHRFNNLWMKGAIMLHTNFVLPWKNFNNRFPHFHSFLKLFHCQPCYSRQRPLSCKRAEKHDRFVVKVVIVINAPSAKCLFNLF